MEKIIGNQSCPQSSQVSHRERGSGGFEISVHETKYHGWAWNRLLHGKVVAGNVGYGSKSEAIKAAYK
jgi:hypothetical protein